MKRSEITKGQHQVHRVFGMAVLVAASLFFLHIILLFDVAEVILGTHSWLIDHIGAHRAGKSIVLGCFALLFAAHVSEAAIWGLYLWRQGLTKTYVEGFYFATATVTALGYGDVVLPPPWRMVGPLIAIAGLLKFGCSTAFLFVVIQAVWTHQM